MGVPYFYEMQEEPYRYNYEEHGTKMKLLYSIGPIIMLLTFLLNARVSLKAARSLDVEEQETNTHSVLSMAQSVDALFGCVSPKQTCSIFLVGLLYAIFALALWGGTVCCLVLFYVNVLHGNWAHMSNAASCAQLPYCFLWPFFRDMLNLISSSSQYWDHPVALSQLQNLTGFDSLVVPAEVQTWIRSDCKEYPSPNGTLVSRNSLLPYIETEDGLVAFPFARKYDQGYIFTEMGVVIVSSSSHKNKSAVTREVPMDMTYLPRRHGFYGAESSVGLIGVPVIPPHKGWCAINTKDNPTIAHHQVLCYNSNNNTIVQFPGSSLEEEKYPCGYNMHAPKVYTTQDTLWVARHKQVSVCSRRSNGFTGEPIQFEQHTLSLETYNITTRQRKSLLETAFNQTTNSGYEEASGYPLKVAHICRPPFKIFLWSSIFVLAFLSIYLYRQNVPSALVPASIALFFCMSAALPRMWPVVVDLSIVGLFTFFLVATRGGYWEIKLLQANLWKLVSKEMLLFSQYTIILCHFVGFMIEAGNAVSYGNDPLTWQAQQKLASTLICVASLLLAVVVVNTMFLNHPGFEMMGIALGTVSLVAIPVILIYRFSLLLMPASILIFGLSLGCASVGHLARCCRLHVTVYCRRAWRHFRKQSRRTT
eukprot:Sro121_g058740.1 n/a (648) ;mRNA; r:9648-11591